MAEDGGGAGGRAGAGAAPCTCVGRSRTSKKDDSRHRGNFRVVVRLTKHISNPTDSIRLFAAPNYTVTCAEKDHSREADWIWLKGGKECVHEGTSTIAFPEKNKHAHAFLCRRCCPAKQTRLPESIFVLEQHREPSSTSPGRPRVRQTAPHLFVSSFHPLKPKTTFCQGDQVQR